MARREQTGRRTDMGPLVIVGASARAAAQWAITAGFSPWCVDLFADRDLRTIAPVRVCPRERYPEGIVDLLADAPRDAPVLFTGSMECHPATVRAIAARHPLLGWTPEAMQAVRDPALLEPTWRNDAVPSDAATLRDGNPTWLVKRRDGTGGRGVRFWRGEAVGPDEYLQRYIAGTPISAVFCAGRCVGSTRQIIGDPALGASGFEYCGSLGPIDTPANLRTFGEALAQRFNVTGFLGIDAILDAQGEAHPVEINPRYTASVEALDRGGGKAYVFVKTAGVVGDLYEHLPPSSVADVPNPGTAVRPGEPICTVFADSLEGLHALADQVYTRCLRGLDVCQPRNGPGAGAAGGSSA